MLHVPCRLLGDALISRAATAMNNLALTYSALGRHEDALKMKERVLKFMRHVLPENHPHIGEAHVWIDVACTVLIVGRCIDFL